MSTSCVVRLAARVLTAVVVAGLLFGAAPASAERVQVNLEYTYLGVDCGAGPGKSVLDALPHDIDQADPSAVVARFEVDDSILEPAQFTNDLSDLLAFELVVYDLPVPTKDGSVTSKQSTITVFTKDDLTGWVLNVDPGGEVFDINFFMWGGGLIGPAKADVSSPYDLSSDGHLPSPKAVNSDGYSIEGQEEYLLGIFLGDEPRDAKQQTAIPVACFGGQFLGTQPVRAVPSLSGRGLAILALLLAVAGIFVVHRRGVL